VVALLLRFDLPGGLPQKVAVGLEPQCNPCADLKPLGMKAEFTRVVTQRLVSQSA